MTLPRTVQKRPATRRAAMALLEVMLAVTVVTALATIAVRLLDSVLRLQHHSGQHAQAVMDLTRLADTVRRDARQAGTVQIEQDRQQIAFHGRDVNGRQSDPVRYTIVEDAVRREVLRGNTAVAHESFRLLPSMASGARGMRGPAEAHWQWDQVAGTVTLYLAAHDSDDPRPPIRIEAMVPRQTSATADSEVAP